MPNPVVDPGFETGDPAWSFLGSAQRRDDLGAHGGSWNAFLFGRRDAFAGNRNSFVDQQGIPVSVGESRVLTFWYRTTSPGPTQLTVDVDSGVGAFPLPAPGAAADWALYVSDPIEITGAVAGITFAVPVPASHGSGAWEVDDVALYLESELDEETLMQRGRYVSYNALVAALQGINGAAGGYWHDLSERVNTEWREPDELGEQLFRPYLALPLEEPTTFEDSETGAPLATWKQNIYGYVPETSGDPTVSSASEAAMKLQDDVVRAYLADPTLGGTIRRSRLEQAQVISGVGSGFGFLLATIEFAERYTRDELGSLA